LGSFESLGRDVALDGEASAEAVAVFRTPAARITTFDDEGNEVTLAGVGTDVPGRPNGGPTVVGPWIYWIQGEGTFARLMRARGAATPEALDPFDGASVVAIETDGETLMLFTSVDRSDGTVDGWVTDYDPDPAAWDFRRVLRTRNVLEARVGAQTLAVIRRGFPSSLSFYQLDTERVAHLDLPEELIIREPGEPVYVTEDEVMFSASRRTSPTNEPPAHGTAIRIRYRALPSEPIPAIPP